MRIIGPTLLEGSYPSRAIALRCVPRNVAFTPPALEVIVSVSLWGVTIPPQRWPGWSPAVRWLKVFLQPPTRLPYGCSREAYILAAPPTSQPVDIRL